LLHLTWINHSIPDSPNQLDAAKTTFDRRISSHLPMQLTNRLARHAAQMSEDSLATGRLTLNSMFPQDQTRSRAAAAAEEDTVDQIPC
jgi:hypothetical protein